MIFVGINSDEAQIGDVAVEITHNGFHTRAQVYGNGARGWESTLELQKPYHYTSYLA